MSKILVDIFIYLFEFILFFYYTDSLFIAKKKKATRLLVTFFSIFVLGIVYQFNIAYLNATLMFITYTLLIFSLYRVSIKTALFHSLIFIAVMVASEVLSGSVSSIFFNGFNSFENNTSVYIFAVLLSKFVYSCIIIIIFKLFAQKESNEQPNKYFWLLMILPLTSIMILLCFRYITYEIEITKTMSIMWSISSTGVLFSNIMVFIIYEKSLKSAKELYDLKTIQHQEEQDKKYFEVIEQSNKEMRVLAHNMKNHLTQIRNLDNINDMQKYIDRLMPNLDKFSYTGISKNKMLDLILSKYITLCESKNIKIEIDSKTANLNYVDDVDLSTLMNNLLDNAIEAAEQTKNGYIKIYIFFKSELYDGLIIRNSCTNEPETENGKLKTTKKNNKMHGIGIKSVKKVIKKYDAVYLWKYNKDENEFETDIVFPKSY